MNNLMNNLIIEGFRKNLSHLIENNKQYWSGHARMHLVLSDDWTLIHSLIGYYFDHYDITPFQ